MALSLAGQPGKEKRRELDFYPTPANVTIALMKFLQLPKEYVIWDPACGNGAMTNVFKDFGHKTYGTDIIYDVDFLNTTLIAKYDAIITNPPFNLSDKFIQKAVSKCDIVAMLLKSQYWHAQNKQDLFFRHRPAWVLPLTWRPDFLADIRTGGRPTLEVCWSVWIKGNTETRYCPLKKP